MSITTIPKGATIELDGKPAGAATDGVFVAQGLEVGRAYPVVARLAGYQPRQAVVQPRAGSNQVTIELEATAATVRLASTPSGAHVRSRQADVGLTPIELTTLPPGQRTTILLQKPGYANLTEDIDVPQPGKELQVQLALAVSPDFARVRIESEPPGAAISREGQRLADVTPPAVVLVEANKPQHFTLTLDHHVPVDIPAFMPQPRRREHEDGVKLVAGVTLTVETNGARQREDHDRRRAALPGGAVAARVHRRAGHVQRSTSPGPLAAHATRTPVQVRGADVATHFDFGLIEAAEGKKIVFGAGPGARESQIEAGARTGHDRRRRGHPRRDRQGARRQDDEGRMRPAWILASVLVIGRGSRRGGRAR